MIDAPSQFLRLDRAAGAPLYRQIYERFLGAIHDGLLKPGDRVPSARALTLQLGLARGTIDAAYALLAADGYLQARGQAGTVVTQGSRPYGQAPVAVRLTDCGGYSAGLRTASTLPLQMGLPALDAFPRKLWARLGARCLRSMQPSDMAYPLVCGLQGLRAEIAAYLWVSRGIACLPSQIFITSGYRHTLEMIVHALLKAGDRVWIENPGYPPTRELLWQTRIGTVPVPVDRDGMMVEEALVRAPWARAAVVTPAHQSPLCVSMSMARRQALLDWARQRQSWIIEDDYDGAYSGAHGGVQRPLGALKSLDRDGRVLYAGSFSKVMFPGMRLAYVMVPEAQVARFEQVCVTFSAGGPELTQAILTAFIQEGHFARHIQRMRQLYGERRRAAVAGLAAALGPHVAIDPEPGGMHLILRLQGGRHDNALAARLLAQGLSVQALSDWTMGEHKQSALMLGYTNIESQEAAAALGRRILALL